MMEGNEEEEEEDDSYPMFPEYGDAADNEDNEAEDQEAPDEPVDDDLGRAIADARIECETEKERLAFDQMIEDHNKLLYPTCEDGHKKLSTTLELLQWKAENGVTDSGFGKLLAIMKRKLPRGNELPASTYEAKKVVCPLGLDVQKIHACINDCILYRGEYENLDACPVCTALRYKIRRDDPGDVEGERPRKRVPAKMEPNEPLNTKFYQLGNGGELIFEHDLNALSDFLGRPHPEFHGIQVNDQVGGELQWIITADLRGKLEPPTSERILFSFRESNWLDGLARGLQEALARLCGQNVVRILASRYAHLVRRDAMGVPMELQSHPQLRHHAEHLDYMLYHTQKELDNSRAYANQTHLALITHGDAIKHLSRDRNKLRLKCAKKDVTITRLRAQIASLEATVKAQEEQLMEIEEDEVGIDLQGGGAFLSDDDDFEEDGFTEEEDYAFLEPGPDDVIPIDIEDEGSHT
ncbi:hypothetical protein QYE76_059420 [Lolium multiflorum]|uniref:Transposon protein, putative, CACTA, En/Spm sub-class n=1 Tax=Lolium multiflorum TaxID=4521 RepID=A0AAD8W4G8_LOLMU|nr:hypothetical protein QYE76_059420 [Lolium multiflorum]